MFRPLLLGLIAALLFLGDAAAGAERTRIALVADGPGYFEEYAPELRSEIEALLAGEFAVEFAGDGLTVGDWTPAGIHRELRGALTRPDVDVVIVLGVLGAQIALEAKPTKPLFIPFVIDPELQGFPIDGNGGSGVANLNYLGSHGVLRRALESFADHVPLQRVALLIAAPLIENLPWLQDTADRLASELGIALEIVPVAQDPADALAALGDNLDGVLVSPMVHLSPEADAKLIQGLIDAKLPSFSFGDRREVETGILIGIAPGNRSQRFSRRVARNVQRALLGEDPGSFPVDFPRQEQLTLNARTARAIGFSPRWDTLTEAEVLFGDDPTGPALTLAEAMREALARNLDLAARNEEVRAGLQRVREARAPLLPQVEARADLVQIDADRARASSGTASERSSTGSLILQQLLYNDDAWTGLRVEKERQKALSATRRALALDITRDGAVAFLDVLRSRTLERIRRENVRVTVQNLELARVRKSIGAASASETYRWENQLATDRQGVIDATVTTLQAKIALNRLLHRELEFAYEPAEVDVDALGLIYTDPVLSTTIDNPRKYSVFRDFLAKRSVAIAPELAQLDAGIAAQQRVLKNRRRAFLFPDVTFQASLDEELGDGGDRGELPAAIADLTPDSNDSDWALALRATYPLYAGGRRVAELRRATLELRQLNTERAATRERIEQRTRSTLLSTGGAFAKIALARKAAGASQQNFDLVGDAYARGAADILDLLDAQNAALIASQVAANSEYDFLLELMEAQRALGEFDLFMEDAERQQLLDAFLAYLSRHGVVTP